jgi:hypothetical protein
MEHTIATPDFKNQVLKFGVLIAVVNIIVMLLAYVVDYTLMVKWWFGLSIMALNIGLILYAGFEWRKQNGGYLAFKNAFIFILLVLLVSGVIGTLFNVLLFQVIDPNLPENITEATIDEVTTMMERFGTADEQIDAVIEKSRTDAEGRYTVSGIFKTFLWSLIFYVIGALIIGAIVKKKRPEFER